MTHAVKPHSAQTPQRASTPRGLRVRGPCARSQVDATFQFLAEDFPPASWGANATAAAYSLGVAFGSHFGPGRAPANVSLDTLEVGNEPWDYNATFYASVSGLTGVY